MAHEPQKIQELTEQIRTLRPDDRIQLLRRVLTPEMELRLLAEEFSQKTRGHDPEEVARDIDETVREIRQQRRLGLASAS